MVRAEFMEKVFALFFPDLREGYTIRRLSILAGISYDATYRVVQHLVRTGALIETRIGASSRISINFSNERARKIVEIVSLGRTESFLSKDTIRRSMVQELVRELDREATNELLSVVLFGSHAKGTQTEGSDCDVLIITSTFDVSERLDRVCSGIEGRYGIPISPLVTTAVEFRKMLESKTRTVAHEVVVDGIVLHGYERYYSIIFGVLA